MDACEKGGTPPGSSGYPQCFQRLISVFAQADAQMASSAAALLLASPPRSYPEPFQPAPLIQWQPPPPVRFNNPPPTVTCTTPPTFGALAPTVTTCR